LETVSRLRSSVLRLWSLVLWLRSLILLLWGLILLLRSLVVVVSLGRCWGSWTISWSLVLAEAWVVPARIVLTLRIEVVVVWEVSWLIVLGFRSILSLWGWLWGSWWGLWKMIA
jgi:hypothetical protein